MAVLGGVVRAGFPLADTIKAQVEKRPDAELKLDVESIVKQQLDGVTIGVKEFRSALAKSVKQMQPLLR